jgi:hypothetical protein
MQQGRLRGVDLCGYSRFVGYAEVQIDLVKRAHQQRQQRCRILPGCVLPGRNCSAVPD